ncbi:hypothetical protein VTJ04DRAFT_4429 [Mycothermus thermophilus]|uniref:uncharacterized protein n=1 Tax=Humicola insolens TaxID=85995 RepID=UPI003744388C
MEHAILALANHVAPNRLGSLQLDRRLCPPRRRRSRFPPTTSHLRPFDTTNPKRPESSSPSFVFSRLNSPRRKTPGLAATTTNLRNREIFFSTIFRRVALFIDAVDRLCIPEGISHIPPEFQLNTLVKHPLSSTLLSITLTKSKSHTHIHTPGRTNPQTRPFWSE